MQADEFQLSAITYGTGPVLVSAGPGSGKTFVLINRIRYLIQTLGISPDRILVLTFSKAAATEMKSRFLLSQKEISDLDYGKVTFGTFHAIFYRILKYYDSDHSFDIISENGKINLLKQSLKDNNVKLSNSEFALELLNEYQFFKSRDLPVSFYHSRHLEDSLFQRIIKNYEDGKRNAGYLDFDDILINTRDFLYQNPEILKKIQNRFSYILIDEFQDINPIQYEVISMIADHHKNIFVVGDDDQSIYSFRGANPAIMKDFLSDYKNAQHTCLSNNYRCPIKVVDLSKKLISNNKNRIEKQIICKKNIAGHTEMEVFSDETSQYNELAKSISHLTGSEYQNSAVILRTNEVKLKMISAFKQFKIPFYFAEKPHNIMNHPVARDIFAYFHLAKSCNSLMNREDFIRICNKPNRYISYQITDEEQLSFVKLLYKSSSKPYLVKKIRKFWEDLKKIREMEPYPAILYILKNIGYEDYLSENYKSDYGNVKELYFSNDIINSFISSAKEFDSFEDWEREISAANEVVHTAKYGIRIMTMHASKGLEFDHVWIPDLYEGNVPIKQAYGEEATEEERRLFYVAMTRAKISLHLYGIESKKETGQSFQLSRFFREIHDS